MWARAARAVRPVEELFAKGNCTRMIQLQNNIRWKVTSDIAQH